MESERHCLLLRTPSHLSRLQAYSPLNAPAPLVSFSNSSTMPVALHHHTHLLTPTHSRHASSLFRADSKLSNSTMNLLSSSPDSTTAPYSISNSTTVSSPPPTTPPLTAVDSINFSHTSALHALDKSSTTILETLPKKKRAAKCSKKKKVGVSGGHAMGSNADPCVHDKINSYPSPDSTLNAIIPGHSNHHPTDRLTSSSSSIVSTYAHFLPTSHSHHQFIPFKSVEVSNTSTSKRNRPHQSNSLSNHLTPNGESIQKYVNVPIDLTPATNMSSNSPSCQEAHLPINAPTTTSISPLAAYALWPFTLAGLRNTHYSTLSHISSLWLCKEQDLHSPTRPWLHSSPLSPSLKVAASENGAGVDWYEDEAMEITYMEDQEISGDIEMPLFGDSGASLGFDEWKENVFL